MRMRVVTLFQTHILGTRFEAAESVLNLCVISDCDYVVQKQVDVVCRSCFVGLRDLQRIRQYLPKSVAILAANAFVSSRLDYCNSLYWGYLKVTGVDCSIICTWFGSATVLL